MEIVVVDMTEFRADHLDTAKASTQESAHINKAGSRLVHADTTSILLLNDMTLI
jgi:hypothetical protein